MTVRRRHVVAVLGLLLLTFALFADVLLQGRGRVLSAYGFDLWSIFFYWYRFGFGELARGNLALWNPYSFGGAPFLGGFQPALLYPPNWLHLVLPTATAINVGIAVHVFLAGLWTYCWTAYRGLRPGACLLAAVVFMFCGPHVLHVYSGHLPHLCSLAWTPLVFLATDHALDDGSLAWVLIGMAAVAMQMLGGNVQYVYYTALLAALYVAVQLPSAPRPGRALAAATVMAVGGAALAAVQLLPAVDAVTESLRADLSYDIAASFPFPPENLATLAFPGLFGDMVDTPYWGRWALHEASLFVGAVPMLLAVCGAVHGERRVRRWSLGMALVALVVALGDYTPLFRWLYDYLPGFRSVRAVARFTFLSALFLAMLAAIGFDHLSRAKRAPRWLIGLAFALGLTALVGGAVLQGDCSSGGGRWRSAIERMQIFEDAYQTFVVESSPGSAMACAHAGTSLLIGGATFVLGGVLLLARARVPGVGWAVGLVAIVELTAFARHTRLTFDSAPLLERTAALRARMAAVDTEQVRVASPPPYFYLPLSAGLHDVWAGADLVLGRYARFLAMTQGWQPDAILVAPGFREWSPRLGMLRIRYRVRVEGDDVQLEPTGLPELPRASLMPRWQTIGSADEVLAAMGRTTFDPAALVLLEEDPGLQPAGAGPAGTVTVRDVSTDEVDVEADVTRPAILLITDNYSTGWKARALPGSAAQSYRVVPADYTFLGVSLPPGRHRFRLEYLPTGFVVGRVVSCGALVLWMAASLWCVRARRRGAGA